MMDRQSSTIPCSFSSTTLPFLGVANTVCSVEDCPIENLADGMLLKKAFYDAC